jgi:hypothetical protein
LGLLLPFCFVGLLVCWFVGCLLQGFTAARLGLLVGSPFEEEEKTGGTIFDRPAART